MQEPAPARVNPRNSVMRKKEIVQAILATQSSIVALPKSERNNYGNYNYASIDRYYEDVASAARKHGLTWVVSEDEVVIGNDAALHRYVVELQYKDGTTYPDYARLSVLHPLMGAQASGSAMSYAEKVFMRMVFKVPTGEFDADATNGANTKSNGLRGRRGGKRGDHSPRPAPAAVAPPLRDHGPMAPDEVAGISGHGEVSWLVDGDDRPEPPPYPEELAPPPPATPPAPAMSDDERDEQDMVAFARSAPDIHSLNNYWKAQQHVLKRMNETDAARVNRLATMFRERKAALLSESAPAQGGYAQPPARQAAPPPMRRAIPAPTRTLRPPVPAE